jgi:DNA-directed RNA polymerase subunit RPC12/RpoP
MGWTDTGQYRCRQCNPDPGPPHPAQPPAQHARSQRYAAAKAGTSPRYRCTECGTKLRKHVWHPSWSNPLPRGVALCDQCIGDNTDDFAQWMGMDIVGGW